jgi:hypothetical protein
LDHLTPHLVWAGLLGLFGIVHLIRAARPSFRPDAGRGLSGVWSGLVLLYLAVGLLAWGLVAALADNRAEQKRLEEENRSLSRRLYALEGK